MAAKRLIGIIIFLWICVGCSGIYGKMDGMKMKGGLDIPKEDRDILLANRPTESTFRFNCSSMCRVCHDTCDNIFNRIRSNLYCSKWRAMAFIGIPTFICILLLAGSIGGYGTYPCYISIPSPCQKDYFWRSDERVFWVHAPVRSCRDREFRTCSRIVYDNELPINWEDKGGVYCQKYFVGLENNPIPIQPSSIKLVSRKFSDISDFCQMIKEELFIPPMLLDGSDNTTLVFQAMIQMQPEILYWLLTQFEENELDQIVKRQQIRHACRYLPLRYDNNTQHNNSQIDNNVQHNNTQANIIIKLRKILGGC